MIRGRELVIGEWIQSKPRRRVVRIAELPEENREALFRAGFDMKPVGNIEIFGGLFSVHMGVPRTVRVEGEMVEER